MKIINLDTLKTMPNGTVFCKVDNGGNFDGELTILTGRWINRPGFNGVMSICPFMGGDNGEGIANMFDHSKLILNKDFPSEWCTIDTADFDYRDNQLFAVFHKKEVYKMIQALTWAVKNLDIEFDQDEIITEED